MIDHTYRHTDLATLNNESTNLLLLLLFLFVVGVLNDVLPNA